MPVKSYKERELIMETNVNNISSFNIFSIGPALADLLTIITGNKFVFKIADYRALLWEWNEQYPEYVGILTGDGYILTTDQKKHPSFEEKICVEYRYEEKREDQAVCLGLHNQKNKLLSKYC